MRIYELIFIVDPRQSDEEVVALSEEYKQMIVHGGGEILKEESWGRRKLAYTINKLTEGKYVLLYVQADGTNPLPEVEHRMRQNDKVLRYLTVRTDREVVISEPVPVASEEAAAAPAAPPAAPPAVTAPKEEA